MRAFSLLASSLLVQSLGCVLAEDDPDGNTPTTNADASTTGADSGDSTSPGDSTAVPTSTTSADESSDGADTSSEDTNTTDTGEPGLGTCVDGINFAGNPAYTGDFENPMPDGQPLLSDPPLQSYHLSAIGDVVAVQTQLEVWLADPGAGSMRRVAGNQAQDDDFVPATACDDLRPLLLQGITTRPNGNIVVADTLGNALIELDDPMGDCTAAIIAGNSTPIHAYEIEDGAAFHGDVDGPGAQAQFFGVSTPYAVGDDLYVIDVGNKKIKRIAGDTERTVTTVHDYSGDFETRLKALTAIDGTLYATGLAEQDDLLWGIDLATDTHEVVYQGRGLFEEIGDSSIVNMYGLDNDGQDLLVASAGGYIFRLSTDGEPLGVIAGYGVLTHYPTDLDTSMPVPVAELPIRSNNTVEASLLRIGSNLYFTGNGQGVGFHIWEIHCGS